MLIPVILQVSNEKESMSNRSFRMLEGFPIIEYLIRRLQKREGLQVIISTSDLKKDDIFETIAEKYGVPVIRAEYTDVLHRMQKACQFFESNDFIRVFANNPLLDIEEMVKLYQRHVEGTYDYSYNEHQQGVLWGTGCEVFSKRLLEHLLAKNLRTSQLETLSFYIRQNITDIKILKYIQCEKRRGYKLNLESEKDYEIITEIVTNNQEISNDSIGRYLDQHKVLARYNLEEPSKEVGLEKLYIHTDKISSILNHTFDFVYPVSVELTLTNICNLDCVYCSDRELRSRQGHDKSFSLETLKKLFVDLARGGTRGVTFEGGGEPTLYPHFEEAVNYARQQGLAVGLITNGTVKLSQEVLRQFEWIRVSLDASTAREYAELKGVDCFERVISNIGYYAEHCDTVGVGYVVTKNNLSQIEALVMRLRELRAAYIQMRPVVDCEELYPYGTDLSYLKFYQMSGFGVIIDGMTENAESGNHDLPCVANGITSVISGDGSVYICGRLNIYDWLEPIGNIVETPFHEIWNGSKRRQQWEMVHDGEFCSRNCPQCRVSKFNQLFERLENIKSKSFI
ncbi:radical SAM protein [Lachnospiraceae bacterium JLR.KK008]